MTLNWSRTASDCQVVKILAPRMIHTVRGNGKWGFNGAPIDSRVVDSYISSFSDKLPLGNYWDRTRSRLSTTHGVYQIRRNLHFFLTRDWPCLCGPHGCNHPEAP